ncbi:MAG TPA: spore coat associated protein CotJA [Clostridia bacterium]|nr:spore coat associated protein CotJA [Clostridia bacterium]
MGNCCFKPFSCQLNPLDAKNTLLAGKACEDCRSCPGICGETEPQCLLAVAYIAKQEYKAGYCPNEALCQGTLFPELVRPYLH